MRKIRCPRCAVINMEEFTTFPFCAACGTRLPDARADESRIAWRRPIRSTLWAAIIGCSVLVLALSATNFFEARPNPSTSVQFQTQVPEIVQMGDVVSFRIRLDHKSDGVWVPNGFENITLRLPREVFQNFRLGSIQPAPDHSEKRGNAYYYYYTSLPLDTTIEIRMSPLRPGNLRLSAKMFGGIELPEEDHNQFSAVIQVMKRSTTTNNSAQSSRARH
jgi:hypothetical protein